MTKKITITLTEDQAYRLVKLIEWRVGVEGDALDNMRRYNGNNNPVNKKQAETVAFDKRLLTRLAQALVTEQAKS